MLQIWSLTPLGKTMARSTRNPRSSAWAIIHHLDTMGNRTTEQLVTYTGLSKGEVLSNLGRLKSSRIIVDNTQVEVG
jgi:hypothetical protein